VFSSELLLQQEAAAQKQQLWLTFEVFSLSFHPAPQTASANDVTSR
jgi:hypothetical protein